MTAVEYLESKIFGDEIFSLSKVFEQAKEMEKQQIIDACYFGHLKKWVDGGLENSYAEQYYNEKFKYNGENF